MDVENDVTRKQSSFQFGHQTRFFILILSIFVLFFAFGNTLLYNFTIICMHRDSPLIFPNGTEKIIQVEMFTQNEKAALYSAIAIGSLIGSFSVVFFAGFVGARLMITIYGFTTGIATLLSPICANWGFVPLFIMRILQGIGGGMTFASIGYITSSWAPITSSGLFLSWLTCYIQLAPLITMPMAGMFCESSFGWPGVYYLQGTLTLLFFALFYFVYRDSPRFHRNVSDKELSTIERSKIGISMDKKSKSLNVPYFKILTDISVIGALITSFGNFYGAQLFMQFAPVYLNKVIQMDIKSTGIMSAVPYIGSLILKFIAGPFSDKLKCITQLTVVKVFTAISQFSMVVCFLVMAMIPPDWQIVAQICYTVLIVGVSLNSVGFYKSVQLSTGPFAAVIMSWFSLINALVVFILPVIKTSLAAEDRPEQWALIFYISSGVVFCTTVVYLFTAAVEPRKWTMPKPTQVTNIF